MFMWALAVFGFCVTFGVFMAAPILLEIKKSLARIGTQLDEVVAILRADSDQK